MNTISLFDYCHELGVPVVNYSANIETYKRWLKNKLETYQIALNILDVYYVVKPHQSTEESILCLDGSILSSTIPINKLDFHFFWLVQNIHYNLKLSGEYRIYFYCSQDYSSQLISGIELIAE